MASVRPLVAANWKMNGLRADGSALARAVAERSRHAVQPIGADILICPPATLLQTVRECLAGSTVKLGAQDCHARVSGAFTGDIAAAMLVDAGCSHVILGHSERRVGHEETDSTVSAKATAALAAGLTALICVGETEAVRHRGAELEMVGKQIDFSVPDHATPRNLVVAYEPIWAIGTGRTPTVLEIEAMHRHIRNRLADRIEDGAKVQILYGGSVKPSNALEVLAIPDVDGALVGGASLNIDDFWEIVEAAPIRI